MEKLMACRVCLATDAKLYDLFDYNLTSTFESVTGIIVSRTDNLPQSLCSYCCALLTKCHSFRDRSLRTQELLKYSLLDQHLLTSSYIHSIDREAHSIALPYAVNATVTYKFTSDNTEVTVKSETFEETSVDSEVFKEESQTDFSDDEPLSDKVTKKKNIEETDKDIDFKNIKNENDICNYDDYGVESAKKAMESNNLGDIEMDVLFLSKQEQIDEIQKRKESQNYLNSFYKCDLCYKGFIMDVTYKNHMARHDPSSGPEVCDVCHSHWPDVRTLRAHAGAAHARRYTCRACGHVTKSRHRAREHAKWHSGHTYVCKLCGAAFDKSTSHLTHVRLQHPSEHCCDVCGESFIGRHGLNMHKRKAHKGFEVLNIFPCDVCGKTFLRRHGLRVHMKKAHNDIDITKPECLYKCGVCNGKFKSIDALNRHTSVYDNGTCDSSLCSCAYCGESFPSEELLREHDRTQHKHDEVRCKECNRTFAHERSFAAHHARAHVAGPARRARVGGGAGAGGGGAGGGGAGAGAGAGGAKAPVVCEICGKKCVSNANLVYHQRTHTGEKPFPCTQCPKRFSVFQRLKIHIRTHTGERPFKCLHCPKAFKHKAALNRHDRVHTGAKPYPCGHCGRAFSQSNSMKLHVRTVHLKLPAPYRSRRAKPSEPG